MRVAMLINNPCDNDARVIREARALSDAGHEVFVLATWAPGHARREQRDGVTYLRFTLPWHAAQAKAALAEEALYATPPPRQEDQHPPAPASAAPMSAPANEAQHRRDALAVLAQISRRLRGMVMRTVRWPLRRARAAIRWVASIARKGARRASLGALTPSGLALARYTKIFDAVLRDLDPDVVHAHELATLLGGWRHARRSKAALLYDSHELELGRNGRFSAWEKIIRRVAERFLIRRSDAVITVCDSIADYLMRYYGIPRPTVVLNSPENRTGQRASENIRSALGLSMDTPLAIYVGKTTSNRGIELAVDVLGQYPALHLALVGPRDERVAASLRARAEGLGVATRLHLVNAVPHDEVLSFIHSADVSIVLIQPVCLSYEYCFPNKLLESILAGIPVVASRLPELERLVTETGAGLLVAPTDREGIAAGIRKVIANREQFIPSAATIAQTRERYGWATQSQRLRELYAALFAAET